MVAGVVYGNPVCEAYSSAHSLHEGAHGVSVVPHSIDVVVEDEDNHDLLVVDAPGGLDASYGAMA